jgi:hypothetical protein
MTNFLELMPTFVAGAHKLHDLLVGATLVLAFVGLLLLTVQAARERALGSVWPTLVRLMVVVILVGSLAAWGDLLNQAVTDVTGQMGLNGINGGVFQAYRNAVTQKFGSNGAVPQGQQQPQSNSVPTPLSEGDTSGGFTLPSANGVKITHYGYSGDPNHDSNSSQGIGAFPPYTTPNSLVPLQSAALSPDVAQAYGIAPGQSFNVTLGNGQTMSLVYADQTANDLTGRVDIFDPQNVLGSTDGAAVTNIDGTGVTPSTNQGPFGGMFSKITDSLVIAILWPLVHMLNLIALGIMWLMGGVQQILFMIEVAVSPIFIGFLMIPRLVGTATKFFTLLVAICLWPIGWAVANLLTLALINIAVNPTNNLGASAFSIGTMVIGYWVVLAIWVIGSSLAAPILVSLALMSGSSGLAAVLGATVGGALVTGSRSTYQAAASTATTLGAAPVSLTASTIMGTYQNFARRPMSNGAQDDARTTRPY